VAGYSRVGVGPSQQPLQLESVELEWDDKDLDTSGVRRPLKRPTDI
jgi:hypothetical protein